MNLKQKTIIAALLHDIGKIAERLGEGKHTHCTRDLLKKFDEDLAEIAYGHHASRELNTLAEVRDDLKEYAKIVCRADSVSAGVERESIDKKYLKDWAFRDRKKRPILSILSTIDIGKGEAVEGFFHVRELTLEPEFLRPKSIDEAGVDYGFYDKLRQDLEKVFNHRLKMSFNKFVFTLLHVLKKYTFFVPADTYDRKDGTIPIPDVSLYEHLRLSSMFACVMLENREKFLLVRGDISGLQKFIAKISMKKALRFLKGKSFFLELLNLAAALKICKEIGIPPTQILSATAGNFTIIAPASDEVKKKLQSLAKEMNEELIDYGLYLTLAWIEKSYDEAKDFEKVVDDAERTIEIRKFKKYAELIENYDDIFFPDRGENICDVCNSFVEEVEDIEEGDEEEKLEVCSRCKMIYDLSEELIRVARIAEESERAGKRAKVYVGVYENGSGSISIFGIGFKLENLPENLIDADYVFTVNDVDFLEDVLLENDVGCGFRFFNIHVRDTSVDRLAESSEGAKYLGILKMDGDDMGKIFSKGVKDWWKKRLGKDGVGRMTPARYATLSSLLEIFFGFCVNEICRKGKFFTRTKYAENPQVYVVFSGGDDLFVLGPWNQIIDLAVKIKEEYAIFTANPNLTISAAITIVKKKFPVYKSYFMTIEALEDAKAIEGKSAISLFGEKIKFETIGKVKDLTEFLYEHIGSKRLPRSMIFALLNCLNSDGKYRRRWKAKYVIARLMERYRDIDFGKLDKALDDAFKFGDFSPLFVALRWVELLTRSEVRT